jgi:hypothetical protein
MQKTAYSGDRGRVNDKDRALKGCDIDEQLEYLDED